MGLIECADCKRQVSTEAMSCPGCGRPLHDPPRVSTPAAPPLPVAPVPTGHLLNATPLEAYGCVYPLLFILAIIILTAIFGRL